MKFKFLSFICFVLIIGLTQSVYSESSDYPESAEERRRKEFGSVLGKNKDTGGFTIFGKTFGKSKKTKENTDGGEKPSTKKTVAKAPAKKSAMKSTSAKMTNPYLWQVAIDSVQLMPILVSDSSGGVLSTDWYEDIEFPTERYKFNILIKSNEFRADSLHVSAFKQTFADGRWRDVKVNPQVASAMEDKIFSKAKELRAWNKK